MDDYRQNFSVWRGENDLAAASDLFDTFVLTGGAAALRTALKIFEKYQDEVPARMRDAIQQALRPEPDPLELRRQIAFREKDDDYIFRSIAIIKRRLVEFPRLRTC